MELKHIYKPECKKQSDLLIVPYGIETELCIVKMANRVLF